jgi:hypothetical protein
MSPRTHEPPVPQLIAEQLDKSYSAHRPSKREERRSRIAESVESAIKKRCPMQKVKRG